MKFRDHPNITAIKNLNNGSRFTFCRVTVEDVVKKIRNLAQHEKLLNLQTFQSNTKKELKIISVIFVMIA